MTMRHPFLELLEKRMPDTSGIYVTKGADAEKYFESLRNSIREHVCEPFLVKAKVTPPGFPDANVGETITGWCLAQAAGYWLVYQPDLDRFCCFWGVDTEHLGAPGIFGSPLYCWSA